MIDKLDLRRITNSQGELARAKTVLSERKVSVDTLKEEKLFAVEISRPEDEGVLRKLSIVWAIWRSRKFGLVMAWLAVLTFNNWLLGIIFNRDLFFKGGMISEFSVTTQPYSWIFRSLDIFSGVFFVGLALFLFEHMKSSRSRNILVIGTILLGLSNAIDAMLPLNCSETLNSHCKTIVSLSPRHFIIPSHGYSSVIIAVCYLLLPLAGMAYASHAKHKKFMLVGAVAVIVAIVSLLSVIVRFYTKNAFEAEASLVPQQFQMLLLGGWFIGWYLAVISKANSSISDQVA